MQYISVKGDVIEVNCYILQLFHRVQCIWLKGKLQAAVFKVSLLKFTKQLYISTCRTDGQVAKVQP